MGSPNIAPGEVVDGFHIDALIHKGGMSRLWAVSRPGISLPLLMKVPIVSADADPAAIVSFEMELMILPRLSGIHVPRFIAAGDFSVHPYIVMERIAGQSLFRRLPHLPLPYEEVAELGIKIATALDDIHRQNVIHLDIKPSNIMIRETGEAALIDFGLSHHRQLPDLMQEEFRLPFGTAPYMAPEQLLGTRRDPRSDLFALGVLLYFFSTGVRPFGESETMSGMKRRLWRDPVPPRRLRPDYPPWLQEIVLRCLEVEPAWRHPTAAQLAFDLLHRDQIKLTPRAEKLTRDPFTTVLRRRFNQDWKIKAPAKAVEEYRRSAPIVAVAVDLSEEGAAVNEALRAAVERTMKTMPSARLACLNVLKQRLVATLDSNLDEQGRNKHLANLVALKHWAEPLKLEGQVSFHVLEALDAASAILEYAEQNKVDQILIGARQSSLKRTLLGSVSAKVASSADCTVTIVRPPRAIKQPVKKTAEDAAQKAADAE